MIRARGAVAQLVVLHRGRTVLDQSFGCRPDALFWTFSAGKPLTAMTVHLLAERGLLDLDAPVASVWPDFGARGKGARDRPAGARAPRGPRRRADRR